MQMPRFLLSVCAIAFTALAPTLASAQYQWIDENGRMVFSDRPPPSSISPSMVKVVPAKVVPKVVEKSAESDAKADAKAETKSTNPLASQVVAAAVPKSTADKELEAKKKAQEAEAASKKQKADAERQAKLASACGETSSGIRTIESGVRMSTTNKAGEREYMSDEAKAARLADLKKDFADNCNAKPR
jgi:hypothetical protein